MFIFNYLWAIRYNTHNILVHKLNSQKDLEALAEEFSAVTDGPENFVAIYRRAVSKKYGWLFITTGAEPRFFSSFDFEFQINAAEEED